MSLKDWIPIQKQLTEVFLEGYGDTIGGPLLSSIVARGDYYGAHIVEKFHGYEVLIKSFHEFYIGTIQRAAAEAFHGALKGGDDGDKSYAIIYITYLSLFRNARAAETIKNHGYPFSGYKLLRELKDRTICLGAVVNGITTIHALNGYDPSIVISGPWTEADIERIHNKAKSEEVRVLKWMVGEDSNLDPEDIEQLKDWRDFYHQEIHRSRFSQLDDFKTLIFDKELPDLAPHPHEEYADAAMYVNRATEIWWMQLRCLPFLQLSPYSFGHEWGEKWALLDRAFLIQVRGLEEIGKKISGAIQRLLEKKFAFTPDTCYEERL